MNLDKELFERLNVLTRSKYDDQIGLNEDEEKERLCILAYFEKRFSE